MTRVSSAKFFVKKNLFRKSICRRRLLRFLFGYLDVNFVATVFDPNRRDLLVKGLQKRVGDGNSISVWTEKWIEDEKDGYGLRAPWIKNITFNVNLRVRELIDFQSRRWNTQALEEVFVPSDIQILLKNQPVTSKEDFWAWKYNKSGAYSVKSDTGWQLKKKPRICVGQYP